jgi:hypothetical protein
MANEIEKGLATFEQRSKTEAAAIPVIKAYINSLDATVALDDADAESQRRDDIDLFWTRSYKAKTETLSLEVKADTKIHESGNFAFETISNEIRFTQGCFMRSKADYFYYYCVHCGDLWIFPLTIVRQWFEREMSSRPNRFREFKTHTQLNGGKVYTARGYLVPIGELSRFLGNELRHRNIGTGAPSADIEKTIGEHFDYTTVGLDEPCAVCGEAQGTHIFAGADGTGHDWVPLADPFE